MAKIHHQIVRSIENNGCAINEYENGKFVLTNDDMGLRAVSDDAKFLRALAAKWANEEETEDYTIEGPEDEEIEDEANGSVVKDRYKAVYKERGDVTHCNDWLARHLKELTHDREGFDLESFAAIAECNGINDWSRYLNDNPSSIGLMRMSVSNRLRSIVRKTGELKTPQGIIKFEG